MKMTADLAYVDSSALLKLISHEPGTPALQRELGRWPRLASSALALTEVSRAVASVATAAAWHGLTVLSPS